MTDSPAALAAPAIMSFANVYTHRKVAENAAKGCDVCYRATSSVLVADEKKVGDTLAAMPNADHI